MAQDNLDGKLAAQDSVKRSYIERELQDEESRKRFFEEWAVQELEKTKSEKRKKAAYQNMHSFSEGVWRVVTANGYLACRKNWSGTNSYDEVTDPHSLIEEGLAFSRNPKPEYYKLNAYVVESHHKKKRFWRAFQKSDDTSVCIGRIGLYFDLDGNPFKDTKQEMVIYGDKNVDKFLELEKMLLGISIGKEIKTFEKDVYYKDEQKAKITSFH